MTEQDLYYMKEALLEGEKALAEGEVPIGAVMVRDGEIIARGHNMRNTAKNPLSGVRHQKQQGRLRRIYFGSAQ